MSSNPYALELKNMNKSFYGKNILTNLNWCVRPKEKWIVFGLNGSGKTTLLTLIGGFQNASSGQLKVLGKTYTTSNSTLLRQKVGLVSHSFFGKVFSNESILDVLLSGFGNGFQLGANTSLTYEGLALKQLKQFGLAEHLDYPFNYLSKGEQQKVLFARALLLAPEILLLDELTSGMDILMRREAMRILTKYSNTVIYVTHHPEEITPFFTHLLLLKKGKIYQQGPIEKILTEETLSKFLKYPVSLRQDEYGCHIV